MSLRITLATYDDDPPIGGQGVYARGLRAALERRGVEVRTVAGHGPHAIAVPRVTGRAPLDHSINLTRHPRLLLRDGPALVHALGGPGGVLLPRALPVPVVYTANHTYGQAHGRSALRRLLLSPVEARAYRLAARVLPISESTADAVIRLGVPAARVEVVHPGVDVAALDRGETLRERGLVLFVGRLEGHKGPLDAVAVMDEVTRARPWAHGEVVGRGALEDEVRRRAASSGGRITVRGPLDDAGLARRYAAAEVVVVPSRYEGLGLVALEAMAAGAAVVAYDVTGLRDAVGDRGVLVDALDVRAMAAACGALLDDADRRATLVRSAREHVRRHHSWDAVAARVEQVYADAVGRA